MAAINAGTFKQGLNNGLTTTWELSKIMVPTYIGVTLLKYTGILALIAKVFAPAMQFFGLPGEAALALVMGACLNIYAGIGAIVTMGLDDKQIAVLAIMMLICHNVVVETGVTKKTGVVAWRFVVLRVVAAAICGLAFNLLI